VAALTVLFLHFFVTSYLGGSGKPREKREKKAA
jgi:hypothetical protein